VTGREWKPGDVTDIDGHRAIRTKAGQWVCQCGDASAIAGDDARPLVIIDPEDREQVERLVAAFTEQHGAPQGGNRFNAMQVALRSLLGPPKPPEPKGLGAVVEDADGQRWVRVNIATGTAEWRACDYHGTTCRYADIAAVRILSEGVTADA
jgi:hypothetical protein